MRLKNKKDHKKENITLRCKDTEKNKIKRKANLYTEGNISEWIIYAAINHVPNKDDLIN